MRIALLTVLTLLLCACSPFGGNLEAEIEEHYDAIADSPAGDAAGGHVDSVECTPSEFSTDGTRFDDANTCEIVFSNGVRVTWCILSEGSRTVAGSAPGRCGPMPGPGDTPG